MNDGLLRADQWCATHSVLHDPDVDRLLQASRSVAISAVLPARNEADTVGDIVAALVSHPLTRDLITEVLVVDSHSDDDTVRCAETAGARVVSATGPPTWGKGGALRSGVARMRGSLGVFLDADVTDFDPVNAARLVAPLVFDDSLALVKGFFDRPWGGPGDQATGGRVTELVARPLILRHVPELAGLSQPLAGEAGFRRSVLGGLPFVSGYGVDIAHVLDVHRGLGLAALAQVDLGQRRHSHQDLEALSRMAVQIDAAFGLALDPSLSQIDRDYAIPVRGPGGLELRTSSVVTRRLPLVS